MIDAETRSRRLALEYLAAVDRVFRTLDRAKELRKALRHELGKHNQRKDRRRGTATR